MERNTVSRMMLHADLFVKSMDAALDFYCSKLGFTLVDDALLRGPIIRTLSDGVYDAARLVLLRVSAVGAMIELQEFQHDSALATDQQARTHHSGVISILVSNLQSQIDHAKDKGLHPDSEVFTVVLPRQGTCQVVFYRDPDGNRIEFLQMEVRSGKR